MVVTAYKEPTIGMLELFPEKFNDRSEVITNRKRKIMVCQVSCTIELGKLMQGASILTIYILLYIKVHSKKIKFIT